MRLGMVGLGRMGANMATRLIRDDHEVVVFDLDRDAVERSAHQGALPATSLQDLVAQLPGPRVIWLMVPGEVTGRAVDDLEDLLEAGDTLIDGGNSRYTESIARAGRLSEKGLSFLDVGTSGGLWGLDNGYCLMVGGTPEAFRGVEPILASLAAPNGYAHVGGSGAGHFTKMVHNGIEYAVMQAYGEGLELLHESDLDIDPHQVAELWRHGSVVRSWLLDLAANALAGDPSLKDIAPYIEDTGEGRWTLGYAIDRAIPIPTIATALFARFSSRQDASFAGKVVAALRKEFGGHETKPTGE